MDADSSSDYGYDFTAEEEAQLSQLIDSIPERVTPLPSLISSDDDAAASPPPLAYLRSAFTKEGNYAASNNAAPEHAVRPAVGGAELEWLEAVIPGLARPVIAGADARTTAFVEDTNPRSRPSIEPTPVVRYPDLSNSIPLAAPPDIEDTAIRLGDYKDGKDTAKPVLSPLECFRTFPRKPLSVSDLTAGAWCELQYFYTLTRLPGGKKTRTSAMKGGSRVHKKLEDEVHTVVDVRITKKEDGLGLRLWNIIQGLRTLRDTGLTREMEVWGTVDGHLVNGVIDGLSHENPAPEWEEQMRSSQRDSQGKAQPPKDQAQITDFFPSSVPTMEEKAVTAQRVWLTDVKTRATKRLPSKTAVRPSKIQLFLYHRFLSDMAAGKLDFFQVFRRYGLNPDEPFSDEFLAQMAGLHDEVFYDASPQAPQPEPAPATGVEALSPDLIRYHSLRELTRLIQSELKATFPHGADSIGPLVKVEYRSRPRPPSDGDFHTDEEVTEGGMIGQNIFWVGENGDSTLNMYLQDDLEWWKGKRPPRGVPVEETSKCRICEFNAACEWRQSMDADILRRSRDRVAEKVADMTPTIVDKQGEVVDGQERATTNGVVGQEVDVSMTK